MLTGVESRQLDLGRIGHGLPTRRFRFGNASAFVAGIGLRMTAKGRGMRDSGLDQGRDCRGSWRCRGHGFNSAWN